MEYLRKKLGRNKGSATVTTDAVNQSSSVGDIGIYSGLDDQSSSFTLKFITWNIQGLDAENLFIRTEAVCKIIEEEEPDIVLLQEVVRTTADYISKRLSDLYDFWASDRNTYLSYFVATLLKKSPASSANAEIIDFPKSRMQRSLLKINATYKDIPLCLLNSHLESLEESSAERKNQLRIVFKNMMEAPGNETVIFGGDTNLREKEVIALGGVPAGIEDVWVACGSKEECAYTFDMTQNDNLKVKDNFKEKERYDRVYIRRARSSTIKPISFELIGLERLSPYECFPSDHWGVLCHFQMDEVRK